MDSLIAAAGGLDLVPEAFGRDLADDCQLRVRRRVFRKRAHELGNVLVRPHGAEREEGSPRWLQSEAATGIRSVVSAWIDVAVVTVRNDNERCPFQSSVARDQRRP